MSNEDKRFLMEYFEGKFTQLIESMEALIDRKLKPIADDVTGLKSDMKVVKVAVTETNKQLQNHERRLSKLESAVTRG